MKKYSIIARSTSYVGQNLHWSVDLRSSLLELDGAELWFAHWVHKRMIFQKFPDHYGSSGAFKHIQTCYMVTVVLTPPGKGRSSRAANK